MKKKQTTIRDIARQLGISHSTVSRALSENPKESALVMEKTRKRVEQKAAEMDYRPNLMARGISTGKTGTLGLLTYEISHEPSSRQTDQILRAADRQNYQIVMGLATNRLHMARLDNQIKHIKQLLSRGIDGLLIHTRGDQGESERILDAVGGRVPVVTFHDPTPNLSGVVLDETTGFCEATEHLIQLGHERIGFIGSDWNKSVVGSAKAKGYLLVMQKRGLIPKRIPDYLFAEEPVYQLSKGLSIESFTAFVCRDDYVAIDVCRGLGELGLRVPEDVAVVGNDDIDVAARMTPALTTLAIPYEEIAEMAMDLILEQLQGQDEPRHIVLESPLVVRESCGANISEK
ncbi:MAG: LacI family DNA-binding transcriptional regulator [Gemmatimonadota bacterium]|nr:LacI family DNA-binding transcriptional regulator [Gemmatimonadota bacterium]